MSFEQKIWVMHRLYEGSFILFPLILRVYVSMLSCIMNICIGLMMLFQALILKVLGGYLMKLRIVLLGLYLTLNRLLAGIEVRYMVIL